MKRLFYLSKKYYKGAVLALFIYSMFWYGTGQYIKSRLEHSIVNSLGLSSLNYASIELNGYPFLFDYSLKGVLFSLKGKNDVMTTIEADTVQVGIGLLAKSIGFSTEGDISIRSNDNRKNHLVKLHQSSTLNIKLHHSLLFQSLLGGKFDTQIRKVTYSDSGYDVIDKNLDKIGLVSRKNNFEMEIDNGKDHDKVYKINMSLQASIGSDSYFSSVGDNQLDANIEYKVSSDIEDESVRAFYVKVNRFDLLSDNYDMKILGELGHDLVTKNSLGTMDFTISNVDALLQSCGNLMYQNQVDILRSIILKMAYDSDSVKPEGTVSFAITGNPRGIKYGKIGGFRNIILFMLQAGQLYDSLSE